jgi:hypothetical protein
VIQGIRFEYEKIRHILVGKPVNRPRKIDYKRVLRVIELETLRDGRIASDALVRIVRERTGIGKGMGEAHLAILFPSGEANVRLDLCA